MDFAVKGMLAVFWLIVVPCLAGIPFLRKKTDYRLGEAVLAGYLLLFSTAELLTLPFLYLGMPLHVLTISIGAVGGGMAAAGLCCVVHQKQNPARRMRAWIGRMSPYMWAAVLLIALEVAVVVRFAHMDADDAFYVGTATTNVYTDTIFSVNPYSGAPYKRLPSRYVLSPFPVFLSVVSSLCGGLHPAIVAHVVFPAVFLPIAFYVCFLFGRRWFPGEKDAQGIYMVLIAVLLWFSGYSIYNGGNFQMVRIWQGKALLAAAFLPLTIYLCLSVMLSEKPEYSWKMLFMANISCCLLSSMGILLAPLAVGIFLILSIIRFRNLDNAAKGSLCCLPSVILGFVYILIR